MPLFESFRGRFGSEQGREQIVSKKRNELTGIDQKLKELAVEFDMLDEARTTSLDYEHREDILMSRQRELRRRREEIAAEIEQLESNSE